VTCWLAPCSTELSSVMFELSMMMGLVDMLLVACRFFRLDGFQEFLFLGFLSLVSTFHENVMVK